MRLYLTTQEAQLVHLALSTTRHSMTQDKQLLCDNIQDRIYMAHKLEQSERRAKEQEGAK